MIRAIDKISKIGYFSFQKELKMQISRYGKILFAITSLDLLTTLIWLKLGMITEANPIWRRIIENYGLTAFAVIRTVWLILLIALIEYFYRTHEYVRNGYYYQAAIGLYLTTYIIFVAINA